MSPSEDELDRQAYEQLTQKVIAAHPNLTAEDFHAEWGRVLRDADQRAGRELTDSEMAQTIRSSIGNLERAQRHPATYEAPLNGEDRWRLSENFRNQNGRSPRSEYADLPKLIRRAMGDEI
jgi:hypothetical protein